MVDLTVAAVPAYFGTMGAEYLWLRERAEREGPSAADYEPRDTRTSLLMGLGSLLAPLVVPKVLGPLTPGKGRLGRVLLAAAAAAVATTVVADQVTKRVETGEASDDLSEPLSSGRRRRRRRARTARSIASAGAVGAVVAGGLAVATTWSSRTSADRLWSRRLLPDLGGGPFALAAAIAGWDFIYYWNHRLMHEARYLWAIHVVHHSSERYNLSTALRQPVADAFGTFVPYGALALLGVRPSLIARAREFNLLYQYWIHTDTIRTLGPFERVLNTPSHHRVHHGSNPQYLDRNHGSILIVWDKLFGTFEPEHERVVYGLTKNIRTFDPVKVATHEHADMLRDVARSRTWRDRLSFVVRGPGWAYHRHAELAARGERAAA